MAGGEQWSGETSASARRRLRVLSLHLIPSPQPLIFPISSSSLYNYYCAGNVSFLDSPVFEPAPVIVGGMALDICAQPSLPAKPGTTTPGKVLCRNGGVARNIAECIFKLGNKPFMISVVGHDMPGKLLIDLWKSYGLSTEGIYAHHGSRTPVVSNIFDTQGELYAAVADVEAVEKFLTPDWIWKFSLQIRSATVVMVDANMSIPSLCDVCKIAADSSRPVWFEPVSVTKAKRVATIAKYVTCTSPNENELISMANALSCNNDFQLVERDSRGESSQRLFGKLKSAVCSLLHKGIKVVIVTLGKDGVLLCSKEGPEHLRSIMTTGVNKSVKGDLFKLVSSNCHSDKFAFSLRANYGSVTPYVVHYPALPASIVSLTGAGDCLVGGILSSICSGLDILHSVAVGVAVAKAAVETNFNVPVHVSLAKVTDDAKQVLAGAREIVYD